MTSATKANAAKFVERYQQAWRDFDPQAFVGLLTEDGTMTQPTRDKPIPRSEVDAYMRGMKQLLPDVSLEVVGWAANDEAVYIEWVVTATYEGGPVTLKGVDRFTLAGKLACAGVAYFDPGALTGAGPTDKRETRTHQR